MQKFSSVLSFLLHPFLIPSYATILFLFGLSAFTFLPIALREMITLNIVVNTLVVPALLIYLAYRLRLIKDLVLEDRRSRMIPIIIACMCYGLAMYMLYEVMLVYVIRKFMMVALIALVVVFVINLKWKISLHMTAMGGFAAMIGILNVSRLINTPELLAVVILLTGLLASARLILGKHTPAQVAAGFGCGFVVCVITMLFL